VGYGIVMGFCIACKSPIQFNPLKVPSLVIDGRREPVCRYCAERWNELHPDNARPILEGAYDWVPEEEL
jgi:hypothetical protein